MPRGAHINMERSPSALALSAGVQIKLARQRRLRSCQRLREEWTTSADLFLCRSSGQRSTSWRPVCCTRDGFVRSSRPPCSRQMCQCRCTPSPSVVARRSKLPPSQSHLPAGLLSVCSLPNRANQARYPLVRLQPLVVHWSRSLLSSSKLAMWGPSKQHSTGTSFSVNSAERYRPAFFP
jgi:hypothetical protein